MSLSTSKSAAQKVLEVNPAVRWQVYTRLQELDISCDCACHQPLKIDYNTVADMIQIWSVVKQLTAPRAELIRLLNNCWNSKLVKVLKNVFRSRI